MKKKMCPLPKVRGAPHPLSFAVESRLWLFLFVLFAAGCSASWNISRELKKLPLRAWQRIRWFYPLALVVSGHGRFFFPFFFFVDGR